MTREQFITRVEATQKAFRRFLVALCCGNSSLADDIAQETYIRAFMASDQLSDHEKFAPWIYRIGYNTFLNNKRCERPTVDYDEARELTATHTADSAFAYQELYQALNHIPAKERTAILLFYMEGYSIKEIAEIQEASVDAVKQQLSRGRFHLHNLLTVK